MPDSVIQHADARGIPHIVATNGELARVISGHPLIVRSTAGDEYCLRLITEDELLQANGEALAKLFPNGDGPAPMTRAQAINLTTPIGGEW